MLLNNKISNINPDLEVLMSDKRLTISKSITCFEKGVMFLWGLDVTNNCIVDFYFNLLTKFRFKKIFSVWQPLAVSLSALTPLCAKPAPGQLLPNAILCLLGPQEEIAHAIESMGFLLPVKHHRLIMTVWIC